MEAAFPYEETPDQLRAAIEVKADLERDVPMDRLVVGDVGYGKTEVALRAAFKAIQAGTQVAVLVPTTVLAAQHLVTFSQRFAAYPIAVRSLSRFVPRAEQQDTLAGLAAGAVDIVIGTHRLLSRDVRFRDLGLVVVDEEQRFGVGHKERLKQLKTEVHVLTLSATPIPRTLEPGPRGRPGHERHRDAARGPPAHPDTRRRGLDGPGPGCHPARARPWRSGLLRPQPGGDHRGPGRAAASAAAQRAHRGRPRADGRRHARAVMLAFAAGEHDVLVCTTIIESGLDIPNANTIVIDRADALGLAQLYQLRGRVGRSARRAYAYLLYRRRAQLSDIARKRLQAIFNASELGAGFQIALSDLEIRGAGNILGAEQHGHMAAVGFDLYTRMLAEAVEVEKAALEGRPARTARTQAKVDLPVDAYLPDDYVPEEPQKLELYRRLGRVVSDTRSGRHARRAARPLRSAARTRSSGCSRSHSCATAAEEAGITSVGDEEGQLVLRFGPDWSRADTMRALAPRAADDPLRALAGRLRYASNHVRVQQRSTPRQRGSSRVCSSRGWPRLGVTPTRAS